MKLPISPVLVRERLGAVTVSGPALPTAAELVVDTIWPPAESVTGPVAVTVTAPDCPIPPVKVVIEPPFVRLICEAVTLMAAPSSSVLPSVTNVLAPVGNPGVSLPSAVRVPALTVRLPTSPAP